MMLSRVLELELNFIFLSCKTNVVKFQQKQEVLGRTDYM